MFTRKSILVLALMVISVGFAFAQTATYSVWVASPAPLAQSSDAMRGYDTDSTTFSSCSTTNIATTTSTAVTTLAGRKRIIFSIPSTETGTVWVKLGATSTTVSTGIPVMNSSNTVGISTLNPLVLDVDANIAVSTISSTAVPLSITQLGVKRDYTYPQR